MKKSVKLFLVCMLATCTLSIVSCSESQKLKGYWYLTKWSEMDDISDDNGYVVAHFGKDGKCEFICNDDGRGKGLAFDYKIEDNIIECSGGAFSYPLMIEELTDDKLIVNGPNGVGTFKKITEQDYDKLFKGMTIDYQ